MYRLICGERNRPLNVVDDFSRGALHIEVKTSISSGRLIRILVRLRKTRGLPQVLRRLRSGARRGIHAIGRNTGMAIRSVQPCKPNQNPYVERFNRIPRNELLD